MRPIGGSSAALGGLNRQLEGFDRAAAEVVERAVSSDGFEPLHISTGARKAGETLDSAQNATLEGAMVDLRITKYMAVANMQVLKTEDELSKGFAGQYASAQETADAIAAAWEEITDSIGRDGQIALYKASLGM